MNDSVILPVMIEAGEEALAICEEAGADRKTTAIEIYMAMESIRRMVLLEPTGSLH